MAASADLVPNSKKIVRIVAPLILPIVIVILSYPVVLIFSSEGLSR
jgi:hypothetical protein